MRKQSFSSFKHQRVIEASDRFALKLDTSLNQGALFILQQLVHAGDWLSDSWERGASFVEPRFQQWNKKHLQGSQSLQERLEHIQHLQDRASHHIVWVLRRPELVGKIIELHLNRGAFLTMQGLITLSDEGVKWVSWVAIEGAKKAQTQFNIQAPIGRKFTKQECLEHIQYLQNRASHHLIWVLRHPELLGKIIELHLNRGAFLTMQGLVILSDESVKLVKWGSLNVIEGTKPARIQVSTQAQKSYRKFTRYCQTLPMEQFFARPSWQPAYALAKPAMFALILTGGIISATSNADVADEMKVLIEKRRAVEAYQLGTKHPELMGDPLFDYFYGVAAVEAGHASLGVLSLERVLLNDPNNDLVRLELARAYYAQGEYQRAKDEFEAVKKSQPPAGVVSTINVYLDDIKAKEGQYKTTYGVYVELGAGYNNNVNAATAVTNITLPFIGPVALGSSSQPQKSMFGYTSIGANVSIPVDTNVSIFANANNSAQRYSQTDGYDLNVTNATTGVKINDGRNTYKIAGFGSIAQMDQTPVPNTYGAGGEFTRQLTETDSVMAAVGASVLQYPSEFNAYNSNLKIATVGYRKLFPTTTWKPVVDFSVNAGKQSNTSDRPDLGRNIAGGNIQVSMLPSEKVGITVGAGYAQSNYGANDLLYQANRKDNLYSGNAVLQYKLTKDLSARMEVTYYNNLSNLNLYGYEQWTGAIKLRYDWNSN
jgi:tetratricopeptide (TPR) repeat protein